jgi:hypothetical protein
VLENGFWRIPSSRGSWSSLDGETVISMSRSKVFVTRTRFIDLGVVARGENSSLVGETVSVGGGSMAGQSSGYSVGNSLTGETAKQDSPAATIPLSR